MPKERSINPAQAQRKAEKQKEIKKNKQNIQQQRNEKLARRNPERVQKQIDELRKLADRGPLRPKDQESLAQLERDLKGIRRAREALGDAAPKFASHERRDPREGRSGDARQEQQERRQNLGKRRRWEEETPQSDSSNDTDPEVGDIPMPRDTPPPIPNTSKTTHSDSRVGPDGQRRPHDLPSKPTTAPAVPSKAVYSSAPQLRDLTKEALKFVPSTVAQKKKLVQGQGRLLEPEEIDKLEQAGYYATTQPAKHNPDAQPGSTKSETAAAAPVEDIDAELRRLEADLDGKRHVRMEEVEDDGD